MATDFIISTYNTRKHMNSGQKHTIYMIFMIPVYPTRKNTGLKTHSEASYNVIEMGGGGQKVIKLQYLTPYFNRKWYLNCC